MTKRSSAPARVLAVVALVLSVVVLVAMVAAALDEGGSGGSTGGRAHRVSHDGGHAKKTPATYTIQSGDTLTAIAHKTGVPVARIERLNPGVDPQILISGEELKLR